VFTNLVDFDSKYGHRRNAQGYANALKEFDVALPSLLAALGPQDYLFITSDHGNDPTWRGTDHTREYGLLLVAGPGMTGKDLGTRATFADLAASWAKLFGLQWDGPGTAI
jgi:phosphopentomutase